MDQATYFSSNGASSSGECALELRMNSFVSIGVSRSASDRAKRKPSAGILPPPDPVTRGIFLLDQLPDPFFLPRDPLDIRLPCSPQAVLQLLRGHREVPQELRVPAAGAVLGLARRQAQVAADAGQVEGVQQRAVVQEVVALALLGVAGELAAGDGQVANALLLDPRRGPPQRLADALQDVMVRR